MGKMQSNISLQGSAIRPLGNEHLRMFRRITQEEQKCVPKVTTPKEAVSRVKVMLNDKAVHRCEDAEAIARNLGGRLATLTEVLMDIQLIKRFIASQPPIYVDWRRGVPQKEGYYYINRTEGKLEPRSIKKARELIWSERLHVSEGTFDAIIGNRPLVFYRGLEHGDESVFYVTDGNGHRDGQVAYVIRWH